MDVDAAEFSIQLDLANHVIMDGMGNLEPAHAQIMITIGGNQEMVTNRHPMMNGPTNQRTAPSHPISSRLMVVALQTPGVQIIKRILRIEMELIGIKVSQYQAMNHIYDVIIRKPK